MVTAPTTSRCPNGCTRTAAANLQPLKHLDASVALHATCPYMHRCTAPPAQLQAWGPGCWRLQVALSPLAGPVMAAAAAWTRSLPTACQGCCADLLCSCTGHEQTWHTEPHSTWQNLSKCHRAESTAKHCRYVGVPCKTGLEVHESAIQCQVIILASVLELIRSTTHGTCWNACVQ
jgi:hypothetical protein